MSEFVAVPTSAAEAVLRSLVRAGIDKLFCVPGGPISPILDAVADQRDMQLLACQHETTGLYMAGGYALATGQVGAMAVTSGPGVLNAVSALAAAKLDEVPLVLIVGEVVSSSMGRGNLQDGGAEALDIKSVTGPLAKESLLITHADQTGPILDRAIRSARSAPFGPVVVRAPVDVLRAPAREVRTAHSSKTSPSTAAPHELVRVAELLSTAQRPLIFAGNGCRRAGAATELLELAEWTRCPVATDIEAKGVFPESHPLSLGVFGVGGLGLAEAYLAEPPDLVISVGARLCDTTTSNHSPLLVPRGATFVQLDHSIERLARSYTPDIAILAELRPALRSIAESAQVDPDRLIARFELLEGLERPTPEDYAFFAGSIDPREVASELVRSFGESSIYVSDIGNHLLFSSRGMTLDYPDQFFASMGLGGMGSGIGTAIGMQLALGRSRRVVAIVGDGGIMMFGNEIATCARENIPLTLVVFNDGQLGMVQHGSEQLYSRSHDWSTPAADISKWAAALGVESRRVTSLSQLSEVEPVDGPILLDVAIAPSIHLLNPRDEALNFSKAEAAR